MKSSVVTIIIFLLFQTLLFSQKVTIYDYKIGEFYQIDLPDTVYVVCGKRVEDIDYSYIDFDDFTGTDLFFLDEPVLRDVYVTDWEEWGKKIDLEYMREVYFNGYFEFNPFFRESLDYFRIWYSDVLDKFGRAIPMVKKVVLIPYSVIGDRVSEQEYLESKFALEKLLKKLMSSQNKKD